MSITRQRIKKAPLIQKDRGAGCKNASVTPVTGYDRGTRLTKRHKYTKNLRNNGRMRVKFDKWLVHILFLCYLTILLNLAEGAEYGGC